MTEIRPVFPERSVVRHVAQSLPIDPEHTRLGGMSRGPVRQMEITDYRQHIILVFG